MTEVHGAIKREHSDPRADVTPIPMWLTTVCGIAICWAGAYLGVFHGGFSPNVFNERESSPALLFPGTGKKGGGGEPPGPEQPLAVQGKSVYLNCQPCHQVSGVGVPGQYPPLAKSELVNGGEKRFIAILLKGLQGPITVEGGNYNGAMPPWGPQLTDRKIAAVASYVRSSFGNSSGEISAAKVAAARKEFEAHTASWTAAELEQIPADANLPDAAGAAPAPGGAPSPAGAPSGATVPAAPGAAKVAPGGAASPTVLADGKRNYMMICVACHQPTGTGLPMVFPSLARSEYVNGPPERFAAMILKGNAGPMTIDGKPYNNIMPGQEAMLNDTIIAAVATFVRASFGNNAPPVGPEVVAAARKKFVDRKTPWTEAELKAWKEEGAPAGSVPGAPAASGPGNATPAPAGTPQSPGNAAPAPAPPGNPAPVGTPAPAPVSTPAQ